MTESPDIQRLESALARQTQRAQTSFTISIGALVGAISAIGGAFWWASNIDTRVDQIESRLSSGTQAEQVARLESNQAVLKDTLGRLMTATKQIVSAGDFEGRSEKLMISLTDAERELDGFQ